MTHTAIATLRLAGAAADTPALRLRAARELAGADLHPPGLPPAAVLVVRRVADPLPRRLAGREARVRPGPAWERAVRERLAAAARSAARPDGRGALPADAPAVLFADPAELLACVVRERVHGGLAGAWWCRTVRRRLPAAATGGPADDRDPSELLAASPREAPAALARLVRWGEAPAVAAALSRRGAARALAALAAEHGLARELVGAAAGRAAGAPRAGGAAGPSEAEAGHADGPGGGERSPEPWRAWIPGVLRGLPLAPEVRGLFTVALDLAAAPHRLRALDGARAARIGTPEETPAAGRHEPTAAKANAPAAQEGGAAPAAPGGRTAGAGASDGPASLANTSGTSAAGPGRGEEGAVGGSAGDPGRPAAGEDVAGNGGGVEVPVPRVPGAAHPAAGTASPEGHPPPPAARSAPSPPSSAPARAREDRETTVEPEASRGHATDPPEVDLSFASDRAIDTRFGGVLYLIHALLDLGLPEAFEGGWHLASVAGPWGTLDLVARGLLGRRFARDPLSRALGELAGWTREAAARHPRFRPAYRVPASWPGKLADRCDDLAWSAAAGRLRVWSAAGYLLAELPRDGEPPSRQARRAAVRIAGEAPGTARLVRRPAAAAPLASPPPLPPGCPERLGLWLAAALPAVRRRLRLALSGGAPALARALAVPGRVHLTSSHVDLVLPLAAADLAVRRAGLDRDPGWLPGFGRVVSFHFE